MSLLATISTVAVASYALLSSVHKSAQALYALRTDASLPPYDPVDTDALPSVDVIVPCFNEDPRTLAACLKSLASQDYPGRLQVYVVDDGSANVAAVAPVHGSYAYDPRFNVILLPTNVGKRKAQIAAIRRSFGDLVLNVDSDTEIASDVVSKLVRKMQDPAVGAAMGQLTASNRNDSWLTRLI
ncbi:glycosyltransferase family 2 protein, partial [Bradyrhizobium sp. 153]|uniref:glycosyltransferase family 2 protein n=1 Tax=Bradyrhizobium sp. 153 TaxID=2782627 RepID=UPI001FF8442A